MKQDMHLMTIQMGNFCGRPTSQPEGGRATSRREDVTCEACLSLLAAVEKEESGGLG